jgi:hypothetical protein
MSNILIIGQNHDPHIEVVLDHLRSWNVNVNFFDLFHPQTNTISFDFSQAKVNGLIHKANISLSEVTAVWWRVKPYYVSQKADARQNGSPEFVYREWKSFCESMELFTPNALWINPRFGDLNARNKPVQLLIAKEIGFNIPKTLISNDPSIIEEFVKKYDAIFKVLTWYFEYPDKMIFTSEVTTDDIKKDPASVRVSPGIYQEKIEKLFELRVTTVGNYIFSAKIYSQASKLTKLDWRRDQLNIAYSIHELPDSVSELIRGMNEKLGLRYAAYDLIVTPDEEYFFLEVNPMGQWLWIEEKLGLPISRRLAELLIS